MSEATPGPESAAGQTDASSNSASEQDFIKIVPLPKIVFFYPTAIIALACGIVMSLTGDVSVSDPGAWPKLAGWVFMAVFTANILIISFDFPGIKFLLVCAVLVVIILGLALTSVYYEDLIPGVGVELNKILLVAGAHFYYFTSVMLTTVIIASAAIAHWTDVWYLHSNELVHKRGILGDVEKYPTINLRVTKEINDLFEFFLLMSGSLVLQPTTTDRPIVLENVWRINHREKRIRDLLSTWRIDST